LKVDIAIVEVLNTRVAVAFVDSSWVAPGPGDHLLELIRVRLRHLTPIPVMLYSEDGRGYAAFQAHEFARRIRRTDGVEWFVIDTELAEDEYRPIPF
jgi:hypothetical protein